MKFNWGTGIVITLAIFVSGMGFMAYKAMQQDFDLVTEDYYHQEIHFQETLNHKQNAANLNGTCTLTRTPTGLLLTLPADLENREKTLTGIMYCEMVAANDFDISLNGTANSLEIDGKKLTVGTWIAKITVVADGVSYYFDPDIQL